MKIDLQNSYLNLPDAFYQKTLPRKILNPKLMAWNADLAGFLNIEVNLKEDKKELGQVFSGTKILNKTQPLSMAYSGHQFGHFNPALGDGRAHLLGEVKAQDGLLYDVQLKGSGQTQYSRRGDGLSPLGPVVREYLVSEAMHSLGVPTTRSLAIAETNDQVIRERALPGGVLTRVAQSHIRVGSFEYFAYRGDVENLNHLIQFLIDRSYPGLNDADDKPVALFKSVMERQASLVAKWMSIGFVHGVMNTDNTSASGVTIDYGPCAFLDETDFNKVFSSIDRHGRYAYGKQPEIMQWNLARFADALLAVYPQAEQAGKVKVFEKLLDDFADMFEEKWCELFFKKIGFNEPIKGEDSKILNKLLEYFNLENIDFTLGFRNLSVLVELDISSDIKSGHLGSLYTNIMNYKNVFDDWKNLIHKHSSVEESKVLLNSVNAVVIPRNHIVERVIQSCYRRDYSEFQKLEKVLRSPFVYSQDKNDFMLPPKSGERVTETFCGT